MILLSFDIEEFDLPLEYGQNLSFEDQLNISTTGTFAILDILKRSNIKATFFVTANFAVNKTDVIKEIVNNGHEIASHGYYHSSFAREDLLNSRLVLEDISGKPVRGFRMPRMAPINNHHLSDAGYLYNSSVNPTWLPGKYNNLHITRTYYHENGLLQLPSSVSPVLRLPLFWLSFHHFPLFFISWLSSKTYKKDGYLNLYFHPWEFTGLEQKLGLPFYITKRSGNNFCKRITDYIKWAQDRDMPFGTISQFMEQIMPVTAAGIT